MNRLSAPQFMCLALREQKLSINFLSIKQIDLFKNLFNCQSY